MSNDLTNFLLALGVLVVGAWIVIAVLVLFAALFFAVGGIVRAHRAERRLAELRHRHYDDVRERATRRPSLVDTDDLDFEAWPVLADEPPHVFPRRRRAA